MSQVFVVVLETEHDIDLAAHQTAAGCYKGLMETINSTLDELEDEIDGDEEGELKLDALRDLTGKAHPTEQDADAAKELYNVLYEAFCEGDEVHRIFYRPVTLEN